MKIKNILISQPKPQDIDKSPYGEIIKKYNLNTTFRKFFKIEGLSSIDFRKENKVRLNEYTAVIFTSKHAVDHFFRLASELRTEIPETMKYFCTSEAIAYYLQVYIQYRKRKIFYTNQDINELVTLIRKNKNEKFLYPCNEEHTREIIDLLEANKINFSPAIMYRTVSEDMKDLNMNDFDMIVFFSPAGIKSLFSNFPEYKQEDTLIGVFGPTTAAAARQADLKVCIEAPVPGSPSMVAAIDLFLAKAAKCK